MSRNVSKLCIASRIEIKKNVMVRFIPPRARGFPDAWFTKRIEPIRSEFRLERSGTTNVPKCPEILVFWQFGTFRDIGQWYDPTTYVRYIIDTSNRTRGFVRCIKTQRIMQNDAILAEIHHFLSQRSVQIASST